MGINNPIPRSLGSETKKAAKILASFVKPNQIFGQDQVIPHDVLKRAKGLAIITVLKAGFLFSGRAGSGVIVARLKDGSWSAPSAIAMAGAGAGGMVGLELTDFVFILNDYDAVKSFSEFGTITLGGNVSVAAGPLGRNAEAAASASTGGVAAVFAYSKTKGLFAGVSVEGSVILERREANRKFYGDNCTSKMILSGRVRPPPSVDPLFRVLESRAFNYRTRYDDDDDGSYDDGYSSNDSRFYDDIPDSFDSSSVNRRSRGYSRSSKNNRYSDDFDDFDDDYDNDNYYGRNRDSNKRSDYNNSRYRRTYNRDSKPHFGSEDFDDDPNGVSDYYATHKSSLGPRGGSKSRWEDDVYDRNQRSSYTRKSYDNDVDDLSNQFSRTKLSSGNPTTPSGSSTAAAASHSPRIGSSGAPKAVALYSFAGEEPGDLPFRKGDVITILKKSESQNDWWTGRVNGVEGIFPANYVELV